MSAAAELRNAAQELRTEAPALDDDTNAMWYAIADWLIQVAAAREAIDAVDAYNGMPLGQGSDMFLAQEHHALEVARAYLGTTDCRMPGG